MGYRLAAAVASLDLLTADTAGLPLVALPDGWGLVPFPSADPDPPEDAEPVDVEAVVRRLSTGGPVAYVWADMVGGRGAQRAEVWRDGSLVHGPVEGWVEGGRLRRGRPPSPISQALAVLGVGSGRHHDEFATIGLDRHRETADWLADTLTPHP